MTNKQKFTRFEIMELMSCVDARNQRPFASDDLTALYSKLWAWLTVPEPTTQQIEQFAKATQGKRSTKLLAAIFMPRRGTPQWVAWRLNPLLTWFPPLRWLLFKDIKPSVLKMQGFVEGCHYLIERCETEHTQLNHASLVQYMNEINAELAGMGLSLVDSATGDVAKVD